MKVGIITITQGCNYGNRLQIYAVQQVLKKIGIDSYLIKNNTGINSIIYKVKCIVKNLFNYNDFRYEHKRQTSFNSFDKSYITISEIVLDENYKKNKLIGKTFDAIVCGSDQLWNPNYSLLNGIYFADFVNVRKRISYAASFGVNILPSDKIEQYRSWLNKFDSISVREESGKILIKKLLDKDCSVLIDPTMMLNMNDWISIEKKPDIRLPSKYILCYFLGEKSSKVVSYISAMEGILNATILDILPSSKNNPLYCLNPSHFIYLIHNCEMVITDSFHAAVFSILFKKAFRVFDRFDQMKSMATRLDTLLNCFDLNDYRNNYSYNLKIEWPVDLDEKLNYERTRAFDFLKKALL